METDNETREIKKSFKNMNEMNWAWFFQNEFNEWI